MKPPRVIFPGRLRQEEGMKLRAIIPQILFMSTLILACGEGYHASDNQIMRDRIEDWRSREPQAEERINGTRPTILELRRLTLSLEFSYKDVDGQWQTSREVTEAGNQSNCVGLSHMIYSAIRANFDIPDNDLWIAIYIHRKGSYHNIISVETEDGHYWYDPSFVGGGIWHQADINPIWEYNLFDTI
jgi:hypothetical protein